MGREDAQDKREDQGSTAARNPGGVDPKAYEDLQGIDGDGLPTGHAEAKRIRKAGTDAGREDEGTYEECD